MKNITRFFIPIFSCLLFFASCVKESDVTTPSDPVISEPIDGEIYRVSGTVFDTLNMAIADAQVKAYFGEVEVETIADQNGEFTFELPITTTEGYFVAGKENYSKAIRKYNHGSDGKKNRLYLTPDLEVLAPDLKLVQDSLLTFKGRTIDDVGAPVEGARVVPSGIELIPSPLFVLLGYTETEVDGTFEITVEKGDYEGYVVFTKFPSLCGSQLGKNWSGDDDVVDLGDFVVAIGGGGEMTFSTTATVDGCPDIPSEFKAYIPEYLDFSTYEQTGPSLEFTYCSDVRNDQVFIGAQSLDKQQFNGKFVKRNEVEAQYDFSLCTPDGLFVEATTKSGTIMTSGHFNKQRGHLIFSNDDTEFLAVLFMSADFRTGGVTKLQTAYVPFMFMLDKLDGSGRAFDSDTDFGIYADIVENTDDMISGTIHGSGIDDAGVEEDFHIRFRVEKR